jgi:hypothetical protein
MFPIKTGWVYLVTVIGSLCIGRRIARQVKVRMPLLHSSRSSYPGQSSMAAEPDAVKNGATLAGSLGIDAGNFDSWNTTGIGKVQHWLENYPDKYYHDAKSEALSSKQELLAFAKMNHFSNVMCTNRIQDASIYGPSPDVPGSYRTAKDISAKDLHLCPSTPRRVGVLET